MRATGQEGELVFQGSVPYGALLQAFEHKKNSASAWSMVMQRKGDNRKKEFLKMRGPKGIGQAEMAVSAVDDTGSTRCAFVKVHSPIGGRKGRHKPERDAL